MKKSSEKGTVSWDMIDTFMNADQDQNCNPPAVISRRQEQMEVVEIKI